MSDYDYLNWILNQDFISGQGGVRSHASVQLNASRTFIEYVIATADRIKEANSMSDFEGAKVGIRRIVLNQAKKETLNSHMPTNESKNDIIDYTTYDEFRIRDVI